MAAKVNAWHFLFDKVFYVWSVYFQRMHGCSVNVNPPRAVKANLSLIVTLHESSFAKCVYCISLAEWVDAHRLFCYVS